MLKASESCAHRQPRQLWYPGTTADNNPLSFNLNIRHPVANLHDETANTSIERYTTVFEDGRNAGTLTYQGSAEDAATAFLAMLQGLQVLARAKGDVKAFGPAAASYVDSISR